MISLIRRESGWALEPAPENPTAIRSDIIRAEINGNTLSLGFSGFSLTLEDKIHSGWLHAGDGGNLNPAMLTKSGDYPLFSADSSVDASPGTVIIRTPLADGITGTPLGADAYVKLIARDGLIAVLTWFDAKEYTPVRQISLCRAAVSAGKAYACYGGDVSEITPETGAFADSFLVCRDLREFGEDDPIIYYLCVEKTELPELVRERREMSLSYVRSGDLAVYLREGDHGISLAGISDSKTGDIFSGPLSPLFRVIIRDLSEGKDEMLTSESGWERIARFDTTSGSGFVFEREGIRAELTAVLSPEISQIAWEADIRLRDPALSVVRFDPPSAKMKAGDDTRFFFALGPGQDIPVTKTTEMHSTSPYPSIGVCMQYLAVCDRKLRRGLYAGFHDPEGSYKTLVADCHNGVCSAIAMISAEGIDEPMNGYHQEGQVVWRLFDGDWYDAAMIYRDWVHTCSAWFTGVKAKDRPDVPKWLLEMPVWLRSDANQDGWLDNIFKAREFIGDIPLGLHLYQWHRIPFDTNYPHYKPAREDVAAVMPVLQAAGIKVMPYINGRLWDTHDRGDYDYQFSSLAKPYAAKGRNGEVITEHYASKNSRGEPVELAVMCPSTALWQEKQSEINDWILNDLGCDAVYVDQIAAAPPVACMDRSHSHRPGGGSWWYHHYYNLIDHLIRRAGKDKCFTTESNAEPFTGHIGGMLVWHWVGSNQVPAYPAVYAGYQPMLGRNYGAIKPDDGMAFKVLTAQSLCFGDQIGWMTPEILFANPEKEFFRRIVELRYKYGEYFMSGRCLRPPVLSGDVGEKSLPFASDAVISAMWEKEDGSRIVVIVNISGETRTVEAAPDGLDGFAITLGPSSAEIKEYVK